MDGVRPSGNASILFVAEQLAAMVGDRQAHEAVTKALHGRRDLLERAGLEMGAWMQLGLRMLKPSYEVVISGASDDAATQRLIKAMHHRLPPNVVRAQLGPEGADAETLKWLPALAGKKAVDGKATAYVCTLGACKMPTQDADSLLKQIQ